jgi:hypothetical protein
MASKKIPPVSDTRLALSKEYWEQVLRKEGLSMDAGTHRYRDVYGKRKYRLSYVGDSATIDAIYEMQVGQNGKVGPSGVGPEGER